MKTVYALLLFIITLSSCIRIVPLEGNYPGNPVFGYSDRPVDEIWERLIDVVTDRGLNVKFIEKENGLIISDPVLLIDSQSGISPLVTHEDRKGKLMNDKSFVVSERLNIRDLKMLRHDHASAKWSVVLRHAEGGRTAIKVALTNISVYDSYLKTPMVMYRYRAHSLGNFETWLLNEIK